MSAHTGLQGKLVLCFMTLLTAALGASCYLFVSETRGLTDRMAGEHAAEISRTLAMASETPLDRGDVAELDRIGSDLMKNRGIAAVAFFNARGDPVSVASRDPDFDRHGGTLLVNPRHGGYLMRVQHGSASSLGAYVQLTTPVVKFAAPADAGGGRPGNNRLVGYLTVCLSQGDKDSLLRNVQLMVVLIGAVSVLVSLPTMYWLVHRVFLPIRQLVTAADRIAAGDLLAEVAIDRPDVIGDLARSFNAMVKQVKRQKDDLAAANGMLGEANEELERVNAALAGANRDLERKVRERTTALESANDRLSRAIAEKDDFLRTVSHDLNAPLRNISGMAAMLLTKHRATFDEDVIHRLERIQKNVQVETDLITELLELSRIKTRRQRMEPVDLDALVRELGEMFAQDLETKNIKLVADTPLPALVCERSRLRQVFQNLIDNAIKYMGDGSVPDGGGPDAPRVKEIHVGGEVRPDGPEFWVRDTGIGIDADDLGKVFCVFRRGRSQAVQSVSGKGVGLASVKTIVETYDGTIRVESRVGRGSTFRFTVDGKYLPGRGAPTDAGGTGRHPADPAPAAGMGRAA